jgi:hypothetical protein
MFVGLLKYRMPSTHPAARPKLLLFILIATVLLILFGQLPGAGRWVTVLTDSAHAPASAVIAACVFGWRRATVARRSLLHHWLVCVTLTVMLGVLIEIVQHFIGRDAELDDVIMDALGAIAGTSFGVFATARCEPKQAQPWLSTVALTTALLTTVVVAWPVLVMAKAYVDRDARFPLLMDADAFTGTFFLTPYWIETSREPLPQRFRAGQISDHGYRVLLNSYSDWGLGLLELPPDWSKFTTLTIDVINPKASHLALAVRIFSHPNGLVGRPGFIAYHTTSQAGAFRWRIPLSQLHQSTGKQHVDLSQLRGMVIYGTAENRAREFYLVNVRVE